jgi:hypothetical protein
MAAEIRRLVTRYPNCILSDWVNNCEGLVCIYDGNIGKNNSTKE